MFYLNHSNTQTQEHFNINGYKLKKLLTKYNIQFHTKQENTTFTNIERYGSACVFASNQIKDEIKNTWLNTYGVDNPAKAEKVKLKKQQTCNEKYGVDYYCQSDDFNTKKHTTWKQNYGEDIENPSQAQEIKDKKIVTCQKHFGVDNPSQVEEIKERALANAQKTFLEKYGTKFITQVPAVKEKSKQTNMEKHGVPYYCMHKDCQLKLGNDSKINKEFEQLLSLNGLINKSREVPIGKYSFDFIVNNILIELNPYPTHNSTWGIKGKSGLAIDYHYKKALNARQHGYRCICIWDWDDKIKIINLLKNTENIFARKCNIKDVNIKDAKEFININHLQNYAKDEIRIGLYYNNELVSIMTFGKPRYNKNYEYELIRYCSSHNIIGGAEKLFSYFIKNYNPKSIISYCDLSKFTGNTYIKLGFKLKSEKINPSKHWYNPKTKQHILDNLLRQRGFDQLFGTNYGKGTSNEELMLNAGFVEIYDCGQATYIWQKNES